MHRRRRLRCGTRADTGLRLKLRHPRSWRRRACQERAPGYRARCGGAQCTESWRNRFDRFLIRWEQKPKNFLVVLHCACVWCTYGPERCYLVTCAHHRNRLPYRRASRSGGCSHGLMLSIDVVFPLPPSVLLPAPVSPGAPWSALICLCPLARSDFGQTPSHCGSSVSRLHGAVSGFTTVVDRDPRVARVVATQAPVKGNQGATAIGVRRSVNPQVSGVEGAGPFNGCEYPAG